MLNSIRCIVFLGIQEQLKKKWYIIPLSFAALTACSNLLLSGLDPDTLLRGYKLWNMRLIYIYGLIISSFFLAFGFYEDFIQRKIYITLAKPVTLVEIFIGKLVAASAITLLYLAMLVIISIAAISVTSYASGADGGLVYNDYTPPARIMATREIDKDSQNLVLHGAAGDKLMLVFDDADLKTMHSPPQLKLKVDISSSDNYFSVSGKIITDNDAGIEAVHDIISNKWNVIELDAKWFDRSNKVIIRCYSEKDIIALDMSKDLFLLKGADESFITNMLTGAAVIYFFFVFLSTAVTCVSINSRPAFSISLVLCLAFFCFLHGWMDRMTKEVDEAIETFEKHKQSVYKHKALPMNPQFLAFSNSVAKGLLAALPDYSSLDPTEQILNNEHVKPGVLINTIKELILQVIFFIISGALLIKFKEAT